MRLYTTDLGIAREDSHGVLTVLDLPFADVGELLRGPGLELAATAPPRQVVPLRRAKLHPVLPCPGKILAVGLNYPSHAEEALEKFAEAGRHDVTLPTEPNVQVTAGSAAAAHDGPIVLPAVAPGYVDYEGEVGVVIGQRATDIGAGEAWRHVAGLTVINDITARDIQRRAYAGDPIASIAIAKSFDTFKPIGPCLVTTDEFTEPLDLRIRTWVNGELRQDDRTSNFLHRIPELVSYLSRYQTLDAGDVIATGSPRGAGQFTERFLRHGDVVDVQVEGVGILGNHVLTA
ncbi:fumarylacetoacetate hydrolase family protein [Nocardia sp. NPDC050713]|uniref:fumarylacetoacetate hydrolase family protein n=1 Tax=Nocardia sp. NPDC050713 TaxID=3154511 RepID=UPI0033ED1272